MAKKLHHGETLEKALEIIDNEDATELELKRAELYIRAASEVREWFKNYEPRDRE